MNFNYHLLYKIISSYMIDLYMSHLIWLNYFGDFEILRYNFCSYFNSTFVISRSPIDVNFHLFFYQFRQGRIRLWKETWPRNIQIQSELFRESFCIVNQVLFSFKIRAYRIGYSVFSFTSSRSLVSPICQLQHYITKKI